MKSKETDNQRLNIKIKRLEKTNDMREAMINQIALNIKTGKAVQPKDLMMADHTSSKATLQHTVSQADIQTPTHDKYSVRSTNNSVTMYKNRQARIPMEQSSPNFKLPPISKESSKHQAENTEILL